ncbi:hypothetical protein PUN28_015413 [Cardiocondyla obscurior]|uniref:Uncharacterized protein n=1 Tax=Cardiocondyla obscurior TaxID=286306 RepID=A0AAW2ET15_9HYME
MCLIGQILHYITVHMRRHVARCPADIDFSFINKEVQLPYSRRTIKGARFQQETFAWCSPQNAEDKPSIKVKLPDFPMSREKERERGREIGIY